MESYLAHLHADQSVDLGELCAAHPELATELRSLQAEYDEPRVRGADDVAGLDLTPGQLLAKLRSAGSRGARYREAGEIARGGMGVVLRVWDDELNRRLAMKVALRRADDPLGLDRFLSEAQITTARELAARYPDMRALADDLRAFLEGRVVAAYETGAWAEMRKWVRRNRAFAAVLVGLTLAVVVGVVLAVRSAATEARAELMQQLADSLGFAYELEALRLRAPSLWPPHPQHLAALEGWSAEAHALLDGTSHAVAAGGRRPGLAELRTRLARVEAKALPQTEAERQADRDTHPRRPELEGLRANLDWHLRMLDLLPWPTEAETEAELRTWSLLPDAEALRELAHAMVDPDRPPSGDEMIGLVWEYACRAGTTTPWWTGAERESLRGHVNLADQRAARAGARWPSIGEWPDFDDGVISTARVGRFAANPFGLHEVLGNVAEWCQDDLSTYSVWPQSDPIRSHALPVRVRRGGAFITGPSRARSAARDSSEPDQRLGHTGVRPARALSR